MKKFMFAVTLLVISLSGAFSQTKGGMGKEVSITGELIDTSCYIKMGAKGETHKACAVACAKAGIPIGVLDEKTSNVYFLTSDKEAVGPLTQLEAAKVEMADKVTIKGLLAEKGGEKILSIHSIEKAK